VALGRHRTILGRRRRRTLRRDLAVLLLLILHRRFRRPPRLRQCRGDHCGTDQERHTPEGGLTLGNTSSGVADVDGAYISGRDYGATVYVGPNNSSSGVTIKGYVIPTEGTLICYEGGFSGASCNSYVTTILAYEDGIGPGFCTEDAAQQAPAGQGR